MLVKEISFRPKSDLLCFNCSLENHNNSHTDKGLRCFTCLNFGRKLIHCVQQRKSKFQSEPSNISTITSNTLMNKQVIISSVHVISLVDTGIERSFIKESIYRKLSIVSNLEHLNISLTGLENIIIKPLSFSLRTL